MPIASSIEPRTTVQERMDSDSWLGDAQSTNQNEYREARNAIPNSVKTEKDLDESDHRVMKAMARAFLKYDRLLEDYMENQQ